MGTETIYLNKENQPEIIEIDDEVRQADYKYTYSDSSQTLVKSEQADMLVSAVEKFSQHIPLNLEEIFIWYFEQKGVDNPERFLAGVNNNGQQQIDPQMLEEFMQTIMSQNGNEQVPESDKQEKEILDEKPKFKEESNSSKISKIFQELIK